MSTEEETRELNQLRADAVQFLESTVTRHVLDEVLKSLRKQLEESNFDEVELREDCYRQLRAVRDFHRQLTQLAASGKFAAVRRARVNGGDSSAA